ncbi:MAG: hypothetical protein ACLP9S_09190 [Syntrophales bacterium]
MKLFFEAALERGTVATSVKVALIVGSIMATASPCMVTCAP